MKKIVRLFCFSIALLSGFPGGAQQHALGLRTGGSYWIDHSKGSPSDGSHANSQGSWDQQIFYRYETGGKWAFETSVTHYTLNYTDGFNDAPDVINSGYHNTGLHEKSQNMEWTVSMQYDISCPAMKKCPVLRKLKSFAGVLLSPTWSKTTTELTYQKISDLSKLATQRTEYEMNLWAGVSHTLTYEVNTHFIVSSQVSFQLQPDRFFDKHPGVSSAPDTRMSWELGLGYHIR